MIKITREAKLFILLFVAIVVSGLYFRAPYEAEAAPENIQWHNPDGSKHEIRNSSNTTDS